MKKLLLLFFLSLFIAQVSAQSDWVKQYYFSSQGPFPPYDTVTGILDIAEGAGGDYFLIARKNKIEMDYLLKVTPSGSTMEFGQVGLTPMMSNVRTQHLLATADSGCLIAQVWDNYGTPPYYTYVNIDKYSHSGVLDWSSQVRGYHASYPTDLIPKNQGGYYVLFPDSLFTLDSLGNVAAATATIKGRKLFELPGGDFIVLGSYQVDTLLGIIPDDTLRRMNMSGAVSWAVPCSTDLLALHDGAILGVGDSTMFKLDTNGTFLWNLPHSFSPVNFIDDTPGGGFVASCGLRPEYNYGTHQPGVLFEVNAAGTIVWSRSYSFPHFGLSAVLKTSAGNLVTGGASIFTNGYFGFSREYAMIVSSLDSAGHGRLETTTHTWPADANYNRTVSFVDDVLYVILALNDSGPARDDTSSGSWDLHGWQSSYAPDWPNSFLTSGVNHKHADYNGDGLVSLADLSVYTTLQMSNWVPPGNIVPAWLRLGVTSTVADLLLTPELSTVTAGDTIKYYLIAGTAVMPVDSIYGLCFSANYPSTQLASDPVMTVYTSDFGDPATNLISTGFTSIYHPTMVTIDTLFNGLISRTDHQNVYNLGDTLAEINMATSTAITAPEVFNFDITDYNALTYYEYPVTFGLISSPVLINPVPAGLNENELQQVQVYPNPVTDRLNVKFISDGEKLVKIFNAMGALISEMKIHYDHLSIPIAGYANGVYSIRISQGSASRQLTFTVIH